MKRIFIVLTILAALLTPAVGAARPVAPKEDFRFVVLSDRTGGANQEAYEMVLKDIERMRPDIVVTVGDFIEGYKDSAGTVKEWDATLPYLKLLSCPVYLTPGNHDITTPDVRNIFIKKTGRNPYYSFNYQNSHFIILDNSLAHNTEQMGPEQLNWLEKDLKALKNRSGIYIFMHKPFWADGVGAGKPDRLHDLFKKYKVTAVFTGHWHSYASEVYDGIRYVVMGSSGADIETSENTSLAVFYQYLWVTVKDGKFSPVLMRAGNTFDPGWVTFKEETFTNTIASRAVDLRGPSFVEGRTPKEFQTDLQLVNLTDKPIKTEVLWETGKNWEALNPKTEVEIAPGDTLKKSFNFKGPGMLYPLPLMKVAYPFGRGKVYSIEKYAPEVAKIIECPMVKKAPVIDGKFETNEWLGAAKAAEFCNGNSNSAPALTDPTEVYFLHDGENLYLAAVCHDTAMAKLKASKMVRDERVDKDDYLGFFFAPNKDTVYQIFINPLATVWDQQVDNIHDIKNEKWNGNYQTKCDRNDKEWTMEIKIPLKDIGLTKLTKGSQIRMNIQRCQQYNKQIALWIFNWDFNPLNYGILKFQ